MLLHVFHMGTGLQEEPVNPIMLGVLVAAVVNAAAGHDDHVRVPAHIEVVVDGLLQTGLGQHHGDVDALVFRAGLDVNVDAGDLLLGDDLDVGCGSPSGGVAVGANVIGTLRHFVKVRDLPQKSELDFVKLFHCAPPWSAWRQARTAAAVPISVGRISSLGPWRRTAPSWMTMIRSATARIRSW